MKLRITLLYALAAGWYLLLFAHNASLPGMLFKMLPILLLAVASLLVGEGGWRRDICIALLFSALGDGLLALNAMHGDLFTAGLGSFLVAQLVYAQRFWRERGNDAQRRVLALLYLPLAALLAWIVLPASGELAPAVGAYMIAITAMVTGAALCNRPLWLFAGAFCFAVSDSLIAVNRFVAPVMYADLLIMGSYYLAQWLIWHGAFAHAGKRTA